MLDSRRVDRAGGLISAGLVRPLEALRHHGVAPFVRRQMAGGGLHDAFGAHVAVHEIDQDVPRESRQYCDPHTHVVDELNLLLSPGRLLFEIELGDERHEVAAPASVLVPAGLRHRANVLEGSGYFIVIIGVPEYDDSFGPRAPRS